MTRASQESSVAGVPTISSSGFLPFVASVPDDVTVSATLEMDIPLFGRVELVSASELVPERAPEQAPREDSGPGDGSTLK